MLTILLIYPVNALGKSATLQKVEAGCGAASAALRYAGASLRYGG
jgi:hypothetical protein